MASEVDTIPLMMDSSDDDSKCGRARFDDGDKIIDFVLPYMVQKDDSKYEEYGKIRARFFESLTNDLNLELETVVQGEIQSVSGFIPRDSEQDGKMHYVKVHAPINVLYEAAEDVKLKMPTAVNDISMASSVGPLSWILNKAEFFKVKRPEVREVTEYFVRKFEKDRLEEFINHDKPEEFFTAAERGRLLNYLLEQPKYGDADTDIGVANLIHTGVFLDAYPLHDGPVLADSSDKPVNDRQRLQKDWASWRCLFRYQPINGIQQYFGEKIALYFSWLGIYTTFLVPAAIVGILCFIYGLGSSGENHIVKETCSNPPGANGTSSFYMCPLCDETCSYFLLNSTCMYARATHVFDNDATLFFAIFMSLWSTLFLEFWKRRQRRLAHIWHTTGFEEGDERVRPEYAATTRKLRENPVTKKFEPYTPKGVKCARLMGTVSVVAFFIMLVLIAIIGVIVFRAAISAALLAVKNANVRDNSSYIVTVMAGLINLLVINILKFLYKKCAVKLTDWENPRTRTDYEDSFTIKMFLFQFINTYSSIVYIAFFKGESITGSPGKYRRFTKSKFRLRGCSTQGCFLELTIQLIIIMVGQQFISNVFETLIPTALKWWKDRKAKKLMELMKEQMEGTEHMVQPRWSDDFEGEQQTKFSLFWEYLELVLQYGFVTMFVAGFPLAPAFALLNNVMEIRIDAYNYVCNCRRPVARRAEDIGAWYGILSTLTSISVLINAFIIAFTSTFIDRAVYKYAAGHDDTLDGYVNWSLSTFNVADFTNKGRPSNATIISGGIPEQSYCRYSSYHASTSPYNRNLTYWMVLSARLSFVLCFVLVVLFVTWLVSYLVPDTPKDVHLKCKREKFLEAEADRKHKEKIGKRKVRPSKVQNITVAEGDPVC